MTKRANNMLGGLLLLFCVVGMIWGVVRQSRRIAKHSFTSGEVYDCRIGGRGNAGGAWIDYVYFINGKRYKGSTNVSTDEIWASSIRRLMFNRNFPVAYELNNPSNSEMLIVPNDFVKFGHTFPDSLRWMEKELLKK